MHRGRRPPEPAQPIPQGIENEGRCGDGDAAGFGDAVELGMLGGFGDAMGAGDAAGFGNALEELISTPGHKGSSQEGGVMWKSG